VSRLCDWKTFQNLTQGNIIYVMANACLSDSRGRLRWAPYVLVGFASSWKGQWIGVVFWYGRTAVCQRSTVCLLKPQKTTLVSVFCPLVQLFLERKLWMKWKRTKNYLIWIQIKQKICNPNRIIKIWDTENYWVGILEKEMFSIPMSFR
jgi:hypothetical protein